MNSLVKRSAETNHAQVRFSPQATVTDRVHEMGLAETHPSIDKRGC